MHACLCKVLLSMNENLTVQKKKSEFIRKVVMAHELHCSRQLEQFGAVGSLNLAIHLSVSSALHRELHYRIHASI
jgi:hypothetical protein